MMHESSFMMIDSKSFLLQQSRTVSVRTGATRPGSVPKNIRRAFTLIELMISIALVVILILGVSQVFQYTTQAVGAGEAITAAIRNGRSAQTAFDDDFNAMVGYGTSVNDSACLIISSRAAYSFRDAKDKISQGKLAAAPSSPSASVASIANVPAAFRDLNGDGTSGDPNVNGEIILPDQYNYRNHRLDTLSFFARNQFARQTGNPGVFVANESSSEAWIWYGHLWLPDNGGNYPVTGTPVTFPCAGTNSTNPNNYYGSQLVLGRMAMLLQSPDAAGNVDDQSSPAISQYFVPVNTAVGSAYPPITESKPVYPVPTGEDESTAYYLPDSRLDVMNGNISSLATAFSSYFSNAAALNNWYDYMMAGNPNVGSVVGGVSVYPRFKCSPFVSRPMTAKAMAQASPYFMGGCSQFTVEFAGDFLNQDNDSTHTTRIPGNSTAKPPTGQTQYGDVLGSPITALNPTNVNHDGQLDFFINSNGVKQTIWYGLPRNTSGSTTTCAGTGIGPAYTNYHNPNGDVVPLRDWLQTVIDPTTCAPIATPETHASFEAYGTSAPYLIPNYQASDYNANMTLAEAQQGYVCAWNASSYHPKIMLIRITMTLEDPTGRLPDGQTFQYVFPVTPSPTSN